MSKDIRSFFQVLSTKTSSQPKAVQKPKKAIVLIDSDDEDVVDDTPEKSSTKKPLLTKRRAQVLSSDSEDESKSKNNKIPFKKHRKVEENNKLPEKPILKAINLDILNKPIKQSKVEYVPKPETSKNESKTNRKDKELKRKDTKKSKNRRNTELGIHGDKDFEKTLVELDEDSDDTILLDNLDILDRTIEEADLIINLQEKAAFTKNFNDKKPNNIKKVEKGENSCKDERHEKNNQKEIPVESIKNYESKDIHFKKNEKDKEQEKSNDLIKGEKVHSKEQKYGNGNKLFKKEEKRSEDQHRERTKETKDTPKKVEKRLRKNSESTPTPKKKQKLEHTDSGFDADQEKWEKKRYSAGLYQAYLHRQGPKNHGQKVYPKGKPDCLSGLIFLRTGVLDSLVGDEFEGLVNNHGGKVVHGVSKKVNYIIVGDDAGPTKLEKARKYKIPEKSEDEFLDMILVKSGMKPKYTVNNDSEDFGIGLSETGSEDLTDKQSPKKEYNSESLMDDEDSGHTKDIHINAKEEDDSSKPSVKKLSNQEEAVKQSHDKCETFNAAKKEYKEDDSSEQASTCTALITQAKEVSTQQGLPNESPETLSWTEKYRPANIKDIIGQQETNSNVNKLKKWLQDWFKNQDPERRKKMRKPSPYNQCASGEYYKAALLSGPPGVGKTTTATLVARELGFDIVEFNASDTRNKRLLHEEISQMMNSKTVAGFATGEKNVNKKRVLLMDEVDGMAGNEDRGGIAELISFIKAANFPIVCMCNNRDHQKMKTLVNYCYGLRFGKPNLQQVKAAMLTICFKEGLKIKSDALARLIVGTGSDIRQTLNHLAMWSAADKDISSECVQKESKNSQKDVVMGPWDVIRKVFTKSENKDMTLSDKSRLFFYDYSLGPLFVQENYIRVTPACTGSDKDKEGLIRCYLTADSLSMSDMIESKIRSTNNWSLLESQAFYSTVLPSHYMSGKMEKAVSFPSWFGANSRRNKKLRIVSELYSHARMRISGDKNSMLMDYAEYLRDRLIKPLKEKGTAGVNDTLEVMKCYSLLRDDMLNLSDLLHRFSNKNTYESVDVNVKVALTRLYNKKMVLNFAPPVASKKKKSAEGEGDEELPVEEEEYSDEEETEDKVTDDALIKVKTKAAAKAGSSKSSDSKQGTKTKGKMSKTSKGETKSKGKNEGKGSKGKEKKL